MKRLFLPLILLISLFFRLYDLKHLPSGLYWDEQDTTYQAYSLLTTGRDYFGNPFPLFPHSFADFRTPINIYWTVTLVKLFGLTYLPSRLTAEIFGFLTIIIVYFLAKRLTNNPELPTIFLAFSPWHFLFSRYNGEITAMLFFIFTGLLFYFRKKPIFAICFFIFSIASYSPAKLFTPVLVLFLFYKQLKYLFLFLILCVPLIFSTVGGSRFHDLSIFTDPQLSSTVDYQRKLSLLSRTSNPAIGSHPTLLDKLFINKFTLLSQTFTTNYLSNFSTEFLFLKGDTNLRHSVGLGQMYPIDAILLIIGFFSLKKHKNLILLMLIISVIPAALTRDGASHAGRAVLLLIPFTLIISQVKPNRLINLIYLIPIMFFLNYFYSYYRLTSPPYFDYGYDQAIEMAVQSKYPQVWLDFHNDSPLMSYLFYAKVAPRDFQQKQPLHAVDLGQGIAAYKFGNVYTLLPGERNYSIQKPPTGTVVIAKTEKQPSVILYPSGLPEFQTLNF